MFQAAVAAQGPKLVKQVKGVIVYVVTGGPKKKKWTFYTDLKNGDGSVGEGKVKKVRAARRRTRARRDQRHTLTALPPQADLTVTMRDGDFMDIAAGKLKPQTAFMRGRLKIKGSMGLAMKLQGVIDVARKEFGPKL